jgi:DNA-binding beta-propeller fold protein YncE
VAVAPNGDIYIADTLNYRIRFVDAKTGFIHTIAGDGTPGEDPIGIGDGGPAANARLNMPSDLALAPNGDLYIADMHHNRIRKIDSRLQTISTVAGSGSWGDWGDDGPATDAALAGPAGVTLVPQPGGPLIFIADYYNGHVRVVGTDGIIRNLSDEGRVAFGSPTRVAYAPRRGWLYVTDSERDRIVPVPVRNLLQVVAPPPRPAPAAPALAPAPAPAPAPKVSG